MHNVTGRQSSTRHTLPPLVAALLACAALPASTLAAADAEPISEAVFKCDGDKSIDATFYPEEVHLTLTDGRSLELPQAISASGARYANADESFVFWNKGDTAFITEGPDEKTTYDNCVAEKDAD